MTWTKLSDDFPDDCWSLSDAAFRLHVEGLSWTNRKLLDCSIPRDDLRRFAKHPDALNELLDSGWWIAEGDTLRIRHHADYQRLREQVIAQQEVNKANGRKGGRPRKARPASKPERSAPETESVSESLSGSETQRDRTGRVQDGALRGAEERRSGRATEHPASVDQLDPDQYAARWGGSRVPWDEQGGVS